MININGVHSWTKRCHMYCILYFINLPPDVSTIKKKYTVYMWPKLVLSLKCQILNMQATYECIIFCFNRKLLWITKISLKKLIVAPRFKEIEKKIHVPYFMKQTRTMRPLSNTTTTNNICLYFCYIEISLYLFYKH